MSSLRSSPPPMVPPAGENTEMVDIEQPHKHDVLCGRGVTTNRFPGNESFRSLVSLNKELYVTSTKRQKMSISRSIVEAVRSLKPPGRFLEKNPVTGMWSDIGDRKAIEKTSQALRDGAAGLRKELSEDLGDPDFLSGLFDMDKASAKAKPTSPTAKGAKEKPVKAKPTKKGHRRTRSNPSAVTKAPAKVLHKQKSQGAEAEPSPEGASIRSLPPQPMSPTSPRSSVVSPPGGGWSVRFPPGSRPPPRGPYPPPPTPEGAIPYKPSRPYHRSHSYHMTPQHHGPPRPPPHHPHSWSHAPPRYPGPTSPPTVVHTPNSPLPPGRHQLTPNGCISKPPLSPIVPPPRWSPRHFSRHHPGPSYPPPPPPDYRHDYPPPPHPGHPHEYGGRAHHPEFWPPPHPRHHHSRPPRYHDHYDYYHEHHHEGLDVPRLGERDHHYHPSYRGAREPISEAPQTPPREFSPPVTPSRRRKSERPSSSASSPSASSPASSAGMSRRSPAHEVVKSSDRMSDASEGTRNSVVICEKSRATKDDATQKTMMSPLSEADGGGDVDMAECRISEEQEREDPAPLRQDVHIISVVHQLDDTTGEGEAIEFMLKDPADDEYDFSPLPFEREDPTTLMELPDDILHLPISSCGPHDD
ncbi:Nitrilase family, member 2 [Seminavis robusta]|uniref:Nitrilase family, member 2 n=1 Tax=Seminavis robusta TaxID=568900 RepID=A0A9N8E390_9STRA|nr:Nitrilase family, member 2 [Seminavis robusta]|eukprot:Sro500_g155200.1 Nitrilase family, member 2 (638) ;mRNA; r:8137-10643